MGWKEFWQMVVGALVGAIVWIVLLTAPGWAEVLSSPLVIPECLERDLEVDLEELGAPRWARLGAQVVSSGNIGKTPIDLIMVSPEETAAGWAHFTLERGRLGLNLWGATRGPDWEEAVLALLYSDEGAEIQYQAWRRIVDPVVNRARSGGCRSAECLSLVAAMANSGPSLALMFGRACDWRVGCMSDLYGRQSEHKARRILAWKEIAL
jgi:hypothetical protein